MNSLSVVAWIWLLMMNMHIINAYISVGHGRVARMNVWNKRIMKLRSVPLKETTLEAIEGTQGPVQELTVEKPSVSYVRCINCKVCFPYDDPIDTTHGQRVQCSACDTQWQIYPSSSLKPSPEFEVLMEVDDRSLDEIRSQAERNHKIRSRLFPANVETIYVGNLPLSYEERDVGSN